MSDTKQQFTADHILIASGTHSSSGGFEGAELCMNSDDVFAMEKLPKDVVVLGGGYIAVEMA